MLSGRRSVIVGTAGWSIPRASAAAFPPDGSALARYAQRFAGVEINSTFYRSHRASTYARWRESVPSDFQFALKVPKAISHEKRLIAAGSDLEAFLAETSELYQHRGPLLLQLPPKLALDEVTVADFLRTLRELYDGPLAIEPRHPSWFTAEANALLLQYRSARVGADPPRAAGGRLPGGFRGVTYLRLHGAPRVYFSPYDTTRLGEVATIADASADHGQCWCIFDNTASGAASANALGLLPLLLELATARDRGQDRSRLPIAS